MNYNNSNAMIIDNSEDCKNELLISFDLPFIKEVQNREFVIDSLEKPSSWIRSVLKDYYYQLPHMFI